ncbi:MAG: NUDIX hydrolase [Rhodospirillales bacterium]
MTAKRPGPPPHRPWQVLDSREVYSAPPYLSVSVQRVRLPDGREVEGFHRLVMPDYALIWPETRDGRVLMLRQYKHGVGEASLTFPAGTLGAGEDPLACAKRELLEETGHQARSWRPLGRYVTHANSFGHAGHLYVAQGCLEVAAPKSGDLEEMELLAMTRAELYAAARRGEFKLISQLMLLALVTHPELGAG